MATNPSLLSSVGGLVPKLPVIGNIASSLGSVASIAGISFSGSKDPERFANNTKAYNDALRNPNQLYVAVDGKPQGMTPAAFLLMKSPVANGGQGGWATRVTQEDAWAKYQDLKGRLAPTSVASVGTPIFNLTGGDTAPGIGSPSVSLAAPAGSASSMNLAVVGLLVLGMLWLVKGR